MSSKQINILKIIISLILLIIALFINNETIKLSLFIISYLIVAYQTLYKAISNILNGQFFDENFLMSLATIGAFIIGEYTEGVAVMLLYQIGELFQSYAVDKSRKSIAQLMNIKPLYANVVRNNEVLNIDPQKVLINDLIIIKPGERVPLDCTIIQGESSIDTSSLTGESLPKDVSIGNDILSGSININGLLTAKVTSVYEDSTVNKILELVENATDKKSKSENFITKFAAYYTPIVVIAAFILAFIPPIFLGIDTLSSWIYKSLSFLVVSCPCALVISIPLSFFGGIGVASRLGILIKGSNYIEVLASADTIIFDKTGTLTKGVFKVEDVVGINISKSEILEYASYAEFYSNHPISNSIKLAYKDKIDSTKIQDYEELAGLGAKVIINDNTVLVGNEKLMQKYNIQILKKPVSLSTIIYVAINNKFMGYILICDEIKPDSFNTIKELKSKGIKQIIMLSGDNKEIAENIASTLNIDKVYSSLLPQDKVEITNNLLTTKKGNIAYVGDGINDAPVIALSDVGFAMGAIGSDAAIEASDIVIMNDEISKIALTIDISKKTLKIVKQNIIFTLSIKLLILILTVIGISNMWGAVFADVGVCIIAILNATRLLHINNLKKTTSLL